MNGCARPSANPPPACRGCASAGAAHVSRVSASNGRNGWGIGSSSSLAGHEAFGFDEAHYGIKTGGGFQIREYERPRAAHLLRVALHDFERGAHQRREIDLVDHEEVGLGDTGPTL